MDQITSKRKLPFVVSVSVEELTLIAAVNAIAFGEKPLMPFFAFQVMLPENCIRV